MIQTDRETFQMMLHQIMERFDRIEDRLSRMNRQTSALEETRDLLHDRRAYLLQVLRGRGVPQPKGQAFAGETEKTDGKLI